MDSKEFERLQHYLIVRFTQLWLLSEKLSELLDQEVSGHRARLGSIGDDPFFQDANLPEEASLPIGKLRELSKTEPEKVARITKHFSLRMEHPRLTRELQLSEQVFPSLTYSSLCVLAFAMFEESLQLFCNELAKLRDYALRLNDLAGHSTMDKTQQYLAKVARLPYDFASSQPWQKIRGHQDVRNLLAHNGGVLDDSDRSRKVRSFVQTQQTVLAIQYDVLQIGKDYIEELATDLSDWLVSALALLDDK